MAGARGRSGGHSRSGPAKEGAPRHLQDAIEDVAPPAGLSDAAAEYWTYYALLLRARKLWTSSSRDVLRNYVEALVMRDRLQAELADAPLAFVVTTVDGAGQERESLRAHPLLAQLRQVRLECRQHANDLALPPAAAVRTPTAEPLHPENPWQQRDSKLAALNRRPA